MLDIPIVIAAFNRDYALSRLLDSLGRAHYPGSVRLIISIDGGGSSEVAAVAKAFQWPFGRKEVLVHDTNLGLRNHILFCGGLTTQYDGIVLLEDDLLVSPWFYLFAQEAASFYRDSEEVSGIALYAPGYNETSYLPFCPLDDGADTFFMQLTCSWGQIWLREHWEGFAVWYDENRELSLEDDHTLPHNIQVWPTTSWKKFYIKYMMETNKYFVYPRTSYTTNFGDVGQHHGGINLFQVPLLMGERPFRFVEFARSLVKYDVFCELEAHSLRILGGQFGDVEFTVDLHGARDCEQLGSQFVLTSKKCAAFQRAYARSMIPIENNILHEIIGEELFFTRVDDVEHIDSISKYVFLKSNDVEEQRYYYPLAQLHYRIVEEKLDHYNNRIQELEKGLQDERSQLNFTQGQLQKTVNNLHLAEENIDLLRQSFSYRVGNKIILPFSLLKRVGKMLS